MARLKDYEQDDEKPFGVGTFKLDDGSEYYLDDPKRARDFLAEYNRESDALLDGNDTLSQDDQYKNATSRLANGPGAAQIAPSKVFGRGRPDPLRGAVAGPGGGEPLESTPDDEPLESRDPNQSRADESPAPSQMAPPELSEQELLAQEAARRVVNARAAVDPYKRSAGVDPRKMQAQGIAVDQKVTREGGLPLELYEQQAGDRVGAYGATNQTLAAHQAQDEAIAIKEAQRLRAEAMDAAAANKQRETDLARVEAKYKDDRAWLDKETDGFFDKAKPDPDRLFKERGTFRNIASAVAQFMGAYASVMTNTPNFAAQILDKKIDRDVDAQMEEYKRGRAKLDSQLHRMAERGMTLEQMRSALKLQQEAVVQRLAKAASTEEGTRESRQAYEALMMERQERFVGEENKFRTEALGKTTVQADVMQPKAATRTPKTPLELLKEQTAIVKTQNELGYEAAGGAPAERAEERQFKRDELSGKAQAKTVDDQREYAKQRMKVGPAAEESQKAYDLLNQYKEKYGHLPGVGRWDPTSPQSIVPLGEQRQKFLSALGNDYAEDSGRVRQALKTIEGAAVRANAGTQTEGDVKREADAMNGPNVDEDQVWAGVERLNERAVAPLRDLDAAYESVRPSQDDARDRAALESYRRRKAMQGVRF